MYYKCSHDSEGEISWAEGRKSVNTWWS